MTEESKYSYLDQIFPTRATPSKEVLDQIYRYRPSRILVWSYPDGKYEVINVADDEKISSVIKKHLRDIETDDIAIVLSSNNKTRMQASEIAERYALAIESLRFANSLNSMDCSLKNNTDLNFRNDDKVEIGGFKTEIHRAETYIPKTYDSSKLTYDTSNFSPKAYICADTKACDIESLSSFIDKVNISFYDGVSKTPEIDSILAKNPPEFSDSFFDLTSRGKVIYKKEMPAFVFNILETIEKDNKIHHAYYLMNLFLEQVFGMFVPNLAYYNPHHTSPVMLDRTSLIRGDEYPYSLSDSIKLFNALSSNKISWNIDPNHRTSHFLDMGEKDPFYLISFLLKYVSFIDKPIIDYVPVDDKLLENISLLWINFTDITSLTYEISDTKKIDIDKLCTYIKKTSYERAMETYVDALLAGIDIHDLLV